MTSEVEEKSRSMRTAERQVKNADSVGECQDLADSSFTTGK